MPGELRELRGRHRAHAVAAVDEHEPLVAGDAVPAQAQRDLLRELLHRRLVGPGRRRAEHERARAGDVSAHVRVRPAHVADDEIGFAEVPGEPGGVDDAWKVRPRHRRRTYSAATTAASAATAGRWSSRPSQSATAGWLSSVTPSESRAQHPRHVRDVGEPVLGAAEPRALAERDVELRELLVEQRRRAVLAAPQRVVRLREVVVPEDPKSRKRAVCGVGCEQRRLGIPVFEELHDHRGLRQQPAVLLEHRYAPRRILLVDPRGTIAEVDLDRLVLDILLGEHDAHTRAVRAARSVVEREHQTCTPISSAIC